MTSVSRACLLDTCARAASGALAGARVELDEAGAIARVRVRVAAGDPLDDVVLRSYSVGAAHMALGWVLTEGIAVDPVTGEVHDLTIRSFGVIRAKDTPPIDVEIVDDAGPALARSSDAVFAAVGGGDVERARPCRAARVPSGSPPGTPRPLAVSVGRRRRGYTWSSMAPGRSTCVCASAGLS